MSKRALCAPRGTSPAKARKRRTASSARGAFRRSAVADPRESRDVRRKRRARVDERLEGLLDREGAHANRADLADAAAARGEAGGLEVEDDELGVLDLDVRVRRVGEPDARAEPRQPRVAFDDVLEQRASERSRCPLEREEHVRRVLGSDRPAPRLHELDEPIRSVERELHGRRAYRTYVRISSPCVRHGWRREQRVQRLKLSIHSEVGCRRRPTTHGRVPCVNAGRGPRKTVSDTWRFASTSAQRRGAASRRPLRNLRVKPAPSRRS